MEITKEKFNDFIKRAFNAGIEEGIKIGRLEIEKKLFKEQTGYDFDTYMKAKNLVDSWLN